MQIWYYLNYKCGFYSPITLINTIRTNIQQQSSFNNIDLFLMAISSFQAEQQTITLATIQRGGRAINNKLRQRLIDAHQTVGKWRGYMV